LLFVATLRCGVGGADRDRTDDLKLAKLPLSQLSYGPAFALPRFGMASPVWWLAQPWLALRAKAGGPG
jgi:hypothetical protein